jgi:hypothetical protein
MQPTVLANAIFELGLPAAAPEGAASAEAEVCECVARSTAVATATATSATPATTAA